MTGMDDYKLGRIVSGAIVVFVNGVFPLGIARGLGLH
jgi:hypothetical protein